MQHCYVLTCHEHEDGLNILGVFASYPTRDVLFDKLSKILKNPAVYVDEVVSDVVSDGLSYAGIYEIMLVKKVLE